MRHLNIEWGGLIGRLGIWSTLTPESKRAYLQLKPNQYTAASQFNPDDVQRLIDEALLASSRDGTKVRVPPPAREFSAAMRGMHQHRFDEASNEFDLRGYIDDHLNVDERMSLLHGKNWHATFGVSETFNLVTRQDWLQQFLDLPDAKSASRWEQSHLPKLRYQSRGVRYEDGSPYFDDEALFDAFKRLLVTAVTWPTPVQLSRLPELVPDVQPEMLRRAIMPAVRYLLLFPWLDDETLEPVIAIWPGIAFVLHRPEPVAPKPVEPEETFHAPVLIEDMTSVLVTAATEPLCVLANGGGLYAKDLQRLTESAFALPGWLIDQAEDEDIDGLSARERASTEHRVMAAIDACIHRKLLRTQRGPRRRNELNIEPAGHDWLGKDVRDRLREMVEPWRVSPDSKQRKKGRRRSNVHVMFDAGFVAWDDSDDSPWAPIHFGLGYGADARMIDWRGAFVDLLRDADGAFMALDELLDYHARVNNPLLGRRMQGSYGPKPKIDFFGYGRRDPSEHELEAMWVREADNMIRSQLAKLGAIELGKLDDQLAIRLHDIGRYMLGLADDFAYHAQPEGKVIVQPNFEVTFLGPAPRAEALVGRLAERTGSLTGTMFRITRASILAAAGAGITVDDALRDLSEISDKSVPDNVKREVQSWFDATRHVKMRQTWVVNTGDQATGLRILAALGKQARQLTPELIEIVAQKKDHNTLIRKLKAAGIFVR